MSSGGDRIMRPAPTLPGPRPVDLVWVFLGGLVGTGLRYGAEQLWPQPSAGWPWATFGVNMIGALILGAVLELLRGSAEDPRRRRLRLLIGTGFCGSLTTYSALALEGSLFVRDGVPWTALGYVAASLIGGLCCVWTAFFAVRAATGRADGGRT